MHLVPLNLGSLFLRLWRGQLRSRRVGAQLGPWAALAAAGVFNLHSREVAAACKYTPYSFDKGQSRFRRIFFESSFLPLAHLRES